MDQTQLDTFRRALISLREEIEQLNHASREAAGTVVLDQSKVGRLSRMDALQTQQMAQETARRRQVHLQKIGSALIADTGWVSGQALAIYDSSFKAVSINSETSRSTFSRRSSSSSRMSDCVFRRR